jgi:hypothetical protein
MKSIYKKLLFGVALTAVAVTAVGYNKLEQIKRIFEKLHIKPANIRNFKISWTALSFDLDLLIVNPTNETLNINGYLAELRRLNFFYMGQYIGTAKPVINEITIPAQNELLFKNIPVVLPTSTVLQNIASLTSLDVNKLSIEAVIVVSGKEYYINKQA